MCLQVFTGEDFTVYGRAHKPQVIRLHQCVSVATEDTHGHGLDYFELALSTIRRRVLTAIPVGPFDR